MEKIENVLVEMLTPVQNNAVLRLPGRRFPGVLVQGDSLSILVDHIRAICTRADNGAEQELREEAHDLRGLLEAAQEQYENAMALHGIDLPYRKS